MRKNKRSIHVLKYFPAVLLLLPVLFFPSCDKDDPEPVNEEEVITTVEVSLVPQGGGASATLKFFDADGEHGSIAPVITVSGSLKMATTYFATIQLLNETVTPSADISAEVKEESDDHLVCFSVSGNIAIQYTDADNNGLPLGLATTWVTGDAGPAEITISLRHQAGVKTGDCPGAGETDVEVTFHVVVE